MKSQRCLQFKSAILTVVTVLLDWTPFGIPSKNFPSASTRVYIDFARAILLSQIWVTVPIYIGYALVATGCIGVRCLLGPELGSHIVRVHEVAIIGWLAVGMIPQIIFFIVSKKWKRFAQRRVGFFATVSLTIIGVAVSDFSVYLDVERDNVTLIISNFIFTMLIATVHLQNSIILSVSAWIFYSILQYQYMMYTDSHYSIQV